MGTLGLTFMLFIKISMNILFISYRLIFHLHCLVMTADWLLVHYISTYAQIDLH